jgi:hypothetical protein
LIKNAADRLYDWFFPEYSVGYFVLKVPTEIACDVIQLIKYCNFEDVNEVDFFKRYISILNQHTKENSSFVSTKFFQKSGQGSYFTFTRYLDLLTQDEIKTFIPSNWEWQNKLPKIEKGYTLIYTLLATKDFRISQVKSETDLKHLAKTVQDIGRQISPGEISLYTLKFQGSDPEETEKLNNLMISNTKYDG